MLEKISVMQGEFIHKFGYFPATPFCVIAEDEEGSKEYCRILQKSMDDNFDYTIELYGTKPRRSEGLPEVIID